MTCQQCREACSYSVKKERAARTHAASSEICGCETFSLSQYSPGIVSDDEKLHFVVSDPKSLLNGVLSPNVLIQIDTGGLSILRDAASDEEFRITINELKARAEAQGAEWYFYGVCTFSASAIRYDEAKRFLCVYDTGLADKPNHADLMGPDLRALATPTISKGEHERRNRARIKRARDIIDSIFTGAARFRGGKFSEFARPTH
jgi:hypothetical protein